MSYVLWILTVLYDSGANVTHSYTLKPLKTGYIETTSAVVTYKTTPNGEAKVINQLFRSILWTVDVERVAELIQLLENICSFCDTIKSGSTVLILNYRSATHPPLVFWESSTSTKSPRSSVLTW